MRVANGANQQEKVQFGKAPESADHFTATVLLVAIVIDVPREQSESPNCPGHSDAF